MDPFDSIRKSIRFIKSIESLLNDVGKNVKGKLFYEFQNIVERYLISLANGESDAAGKLNSEIYEKGFFDPVDLYSKVIRDLSHGPTIGDNSELSKPIIEMKGTLLHVTINGVTAKANGQAINRIQSHFPEIGMQYIYASMFRYECILPRGQQWALPLEIYEEQFFKGRQILECFASPFNSAMIQIARRSKDVKYCSLFAEDCAIGSLGSFWTMNLNTIPKNVILIANPPFIEWVLERLAKIMKNVEHDFIVTMPTWEDSNGYRIMESIPDIQIKKLNPHEYNYTQGDKKINATFPSTIFSRCASAHTRPGHCVPGPSIKSSNN